jgi:hypothetical protein
MMSNEEKRETIRGLLLAGQAVRIVFKVSDEGVVVPEAYQNETHLALDFGLNGSDAPTDLDLSEEAIGATLRFGTDFLWCSVPWASIIGAFPFGDPKPQETTAWQPKLLKGGLN